MLNEFAGVCCWQLQLYADCMCSFRIKRAGLACDRIQFVKTSRARPSFLAELQAPPGELQAQCCRATSSTCRATCSMLQSYKLHLQSYMLNVAELQAQLVAVHALTLCRHALVSHQQPLLLNLSFGSAQDQTISSSPPSCEQWQICLLVA